MRGGAVFFVGLAFPFPLISQLRKRSVNGRRRLLFGCRPFPPSLARCRPERGCRNWKSTSFLFFIHKGGPTVPFPFFAVITKEEVRVVELPYIFFSPFEIACEKWGKGLNGP